MADITNVFKATVKTIRVRQKNVGAITGIDKNILPACRKAKSEFTVNAMEVVSKHLSSLFLYCLGNICCTIALTDYS